MNILKQYDEYIKAYNELADKLDELGASGEIFSDLSALCAMALNINPDELFEGLREYQNSLSV